MKNVENISVVSELLTVKEASECCFGKKRFIIAEAQYVVGNTIFGDCQCSIQFGYF